jgi:hypothetical protein
LAVCFIQEFAIEPGDRTTTNYDAVNEKLTENQAAPEGLVIHFAGFDEDAGVFRIMTIWKTKEQGQAYHDNAVMPAVRAVFGGDLDPSRAPTREGDYELHHVALP